MRLLLLCNVTETECHLRVKEKLPNLSSAAFFYVKGIQNGHLIREIRPTNALHRKHYLRTHPADQRYLVMPM